MRFTRILLIAVLAAALLLTVGGVLAQEGFRPDELLPSSYHLNGITHIYQGWNNCGPATLTMALTYYGYPADQNPAALWLKPNTEDKNVSPWQMEEYVDTQVGGNMRALLRYGGTLERLKALIANQFPTLIEAGYNPPSANQGWMGHYLLMSGYDDARGVFVTQDSYDGPNLEYTYDHVREYWQHFNNVYLVVYPLEREAELMELLGDDADPEQNIMNALIQSVEDAQANRTSPFAWFNMGSNYTMLGEYENAAAAFDEARKYELPWRMLWYQFGPFEAYLEVGRYDDVIALAQQNLNDGGGQYVEETFYYGALAREAMGETERAISNLNGALSFNPNFTPARIARDALLGQ